MQLKARAISPLAWGILIIGFCVPASSSSAGIVKYLESRGCDLLDIFSLRLSAANHARGAGVLVRATALAQAGAVYFEGDQIGMDRRAIGLWREKRTQVAIGPVAFSDVDMQTVHGNSFAYADTPWSKAEARGIVRNDYYWDDGREHPLAFGVELQPGILPGFEFRVDPLEAVDFVFGWIGLDGFFNDDLHSPKKPKVETLPEREGPEEGSESAKPEAGKKEPPVLPKPETLQPPAVEIPPASPPADTKP